MRLASDFELNKFDFCFFAFCVFIWAKTMSRNSALIKLFGAIVCLGSMVYNFWSRIRRLSMHQPSVQMGAMVCNQWHYMIHSAGNLPINQICIKKWMRTKDSRMSRRIALTKSLSLNWRTARHSKFLLLEIIEYRIRGLWTHSIDSMGHEMKRTKWNK